MTHIAWGDGEWAELLNPPALDTKRITISGRPGRLVEDEGPNGEPRCLVKFTLERGAGAISVMDSRFGIDTCDTARTLATRIAERTS